MQLWYHTTNYQSEVYGGAINTEHADLHSDKTCTQTTELEQLISLAISTIFSFT